MSADVILLAEAQVLTDDIRRDSIVWLARQCADIRHSDVERMLAQWAHKSLDAKRQAYLFADYRECSERAAALLDGVADWTDFYDDGELSPLGDRHDLAAELLADRAAEALFALTYGETER